MKEAVIFVPGFDAKCQNYFLDTFLAPGLLARLEDIDVKLDPEEVKIPGQTGKRFLCRPEDEEKTMDIYEVYWDDLVDRLSAKENIPKFWQGLSMILYWFGRCWKIMRTSPMFFWQTSFILMMVFLWYFGIVILVLSTIAEQVPIIEDIPALQKFLSPIIASAASGKGWLIWSIFSFILAVLPLSINLVIDFIHFFTTYLRDESVHGKPPVRDLVRNRVKQAVDNVISEGSYQKFTVLAHSMGGLSATDFFADYKGHQGRKFRFITLGSTLETASIAANWINTEIQNCLGNPCVERWDDFYSNQDWFCSKVPVRSGQPQPKLTSKEVSFKVSLFKQFSGESHMEYFYDPKVLRHLVMG
jgi:hypothetical protein